MCPVLYIDVVVDWSGALMWGAMRMSNPPIGGGYESALPVESVDENVCWARKLIGFL